MAKQKVSKQKIFLFSGDILILLLSLNLATLIRLRVPFHSYLDSLSAALVFSGLLAGILTSFYVLGLYSTQRNYSNFQILYLTTGSVFLATLLALALFYIFPFRLGRGIYLIAIFNVWWITILWRRVYLTLFKLTIPVRNVLIVGNSTNNDELFELLSKDPEYNLKGCSHADQGKAYSTALPYLGEFATIPNLSSRYQINDIIVTSQHLGEETLDKFLLACKLQGTNIYDFLTFYEIKTGKIHISTIKPYWLLASDGFNKLGSKFYVRLKRSIDVVAAIFLLALSLPLIFLVSLAIKLSSKGPIFFVQERQGENQRPFRLFKYRTMIENAERGMPQWTKENDVRITFIGGILRKTRLDELPQIINILKGDMSLIGPRPEREYFIKELQENIPYYSLRFTVKPGLSGWAQVNYPYGSSQKDALEKLQYDLYYIKNMSLALDFKILLRTTTVIIFGLGR